MRARMVGRHITTEAGKYYDLLGSGTRYGFGDDIAYAVRESGSVTDPILAAIPAGWPWADTDIVILDD